MTQKKKIEIYPDMDALCKSLTQWIKEYIEKHGTTNIALSGGSTPIALFDYWATHHAKDIEWQNVRFFWGDERCVPPTDEQSNFKAANEHLFLPLGIPETAYFRIHGENNPSEEARRYAEILEQELPQTNGTPTFDIILLGMGDDGHTASIFPHEIAAWDAPTPCIVATHPISGQQRISLTGSIINQAKEVVFLVTGSNKASKVKEIIENNRVSATIYPAARVAPINGTLTWCLDDAAAAQLTKKD